MCAGNNFNRRSSKSGNPVKIRKMQFKFKAKGKDGKLVEAVRESKDKLTLFSELKSEGLMLLVAEPLEGGGLIQFLKWLNETVVRIDLHEKIIFARNLSAMISAGLPLSRAIEILEKQTTNQKFRKILNVLGKEIKEGNTLSSGLAKFPNVFIPLFVAMVRAGEESGGMSGALKEIAMHLEKSYIMMKKVRGAMMYPAIIICAVVVIGILMLIFVVPTLISTFKELNVELPASTRFVIFISNLFTEYSIYLLLGIIIAVIGGVFALRTRRGQQIFDSIILRLPFVGNLVKEINSAQTTRTLSSLISAGVNITESISITRDVIQNYYYKEALAVAVSRIEKGAPISEVFKEKTNLFPVMVGEMMEVGEETGKLSQMLLDIATFYEEEVESATKDLSTIIEPLLMVLIGCAVGFFAISMISPTYSLLNSI